MEQLIAQLEAKVSLLTERLESAYQEIQQLKGKNHDVIEHSASMDLLQHMADRSTEDQLQLYIEDSLDLLETVSTPKQAMRENLVETQLSFDLLHECAASSTKSTTTEQTDHMTIQQTELNSLPEAQDEKLVDNNSSAQEAINNTSDTATLTPEQKKRQKNQKNNRRLIKMLEDRYPKAFDWNQPKPLKVGIDKDMVLDDDFNASKQKRALAAYTRSDRYKKCLLSGQPRVDLEGIAISNEPALPAEMMPKKEKATFNRQKTDKAFRPTSRPTSNRPQAKTKAPKPQSSTTPRKKEDDTYNSLSAEERMKAKLEKLLNKS